MGYTVRHDDRRGPETRLRFVTSGVLLRTLPSRPDLRGVGALVFDEIHERHLADDLLLAWARHLRATARPDLVVVAMSATLDAERFGAYLDAPVVESAGRLHPIAIAHEERPESRPVPARVASALRRLCDDGLDGDVLVFLSGLDAIERARSACRRAAADHDLELVALHGSLSPSETRAALAPRPRRKVLLATNVAESSITLEGVAAVIDSGLHKVARSSPWTGLTSLSEEPIPQDSATQRAGRAGRTGPGRCLRLYLEAELSRRPGHLDPEVRRVDLAQAALTLAALDGPEELAWLDPPQPARWQAARDLLARLGALEGGAITARGRELLRYPLHPRLGRLLTAAAAEGAADLGAAAAALLGEGARLPDMPAGHSDVLALVRAWRGRRLEASLGRRVHRVTRDLLRLVPGKGPRAEHPEDGLLRAVLAGFPDRVGRRRDRRSDRVALAGGVEARLGHASTVRDETWLVAVDAAGGSRPLIRLASGIEPDWLLELPHAEALLSESVEVRWDPRAERVEASSTLRFDGVVLEAEPVDARGLDEATALLRRQARAAGLGKLADASALERLMHRRRFAHEVDPAIPGLDDEAVWALVDELCEGRASLKELQQADLLACLALPYHLKKRLDRAAPERLQLPSGRRARVKYFAEGLPRVSGFVQDFLGMEDTPRLGPAGVRPLLELLAPNRRPVQITDDLRGFWDRTWPEVRKELRGRYPKHAWPEDPLAPGASRR